jgi:hypothetical protein|tara:strand:+ start:276 stop:623 length:348 start_codon:yes stop_codon:yes gene_type:complete
MSDYKAAYKLSLKHIEELEERLDQKDNLIERILYYYIDSTHPEEGERTATRRIYKLIYGDSWKNYIEGEFLTKEESADWFDDNHDNYLCSGDHIANMSYLDLAQWQVGKGGEECR